MTPPTNIDEFQDGTIFIDPANWGDSQLPTSIAEFQDGNWWVPYEDGEVYLRLSWAHD